MTNKALIYNYIIYSNTIHERKSYRLFVEQDSDKEVNEMSEGLKLKGEVWKKKSEKYLFLQS